MCSNYRSSYLQTDDRLDAEFEKRRGVVDISAYAASRGGVNERCSLKIYHMKQLLSQLI